MTDTNDNPTPNPQGTESGEAPNPEAGKTYTEAEFNAMVATRLSKQEKAFEKRLADELKKAEERAKLGDAERLQAERDELAQKLTALETEKAELALRAALAKHVTDVDYAIFKVQQAGDKYLTKDGAPNTDALLQDFPTLKTTPDPKPGPAPTHGGGGSSKGFDMNSAIRNAAGRT